MAQITVGALTNGQTTYRVKFSTVGYKSSSWTFDTMEEVLDYIEREEKNYKRDPEKFREMADEKRQEQKIRRGRSLSRSLPETPKKGGKAKKKSSPVHEVPGDH
jgi:hypothetical protein